MGTGGGGFQALPAGYLIPFGFQARVYSAMKESFAMLGLIDMIETETGAPLAFAQDNDTTVTGVQISAGSTTPNEGQQITEQDILNLQATKLNAYTYSSKAVLYSIELGRDAGFDLPAYLQERLAIRLGRVVNNALTNGTGTNQPTGLVNSCPQGAVAVGTVEDDGASNNPNLCGSQDLINLVESVDPIYRKRPTCAFMLHDSTLSQIKQLRSKDGKLQKLWRSGLDNASGVETLLGYRVITNSDMPTAPAGPNSPPLPFRSVVFGDISQYRARRAPMMMVMLDETRADYGLTGIVAFARCDGALIDGGGGAVKALVNSY
jgi:HK97 family phage major capsid protein